MPVLYQVYHLVFLTAIGTSRHYVGVTKVHSGETPAAALTRRRRWHINKPVAWLKCAIGSSLRLESVGAPQCKSDALADEAIEAARRIAETPTLCRGGPWCVPGRYSVLPKGHARQVADVNAAVAELASKAAQRRALRDLAVGRRFAAVSAHLTGTAFVDDKELAKVRRRRSQSSHAHRQLYASSRAAEVRYNQSAAGKRSQKRRNARRV